MIRTVPTWLMMVVAAAACAGQVGGSGPGADGGVTADASARDDASDPPPAAAAYTVYLHFDGLTVTPGNADDSSQNQSSVVFNATTIPAYGHPQLEGQLVSEMRAILAPYDIAIVTERPDDPPYMMIVLGGSSVQVGLPGGVGSIAPVSCTASARGVGFMFDSFTNRHEIVEQLITMVGIMNGIPISTKDRDCMCYGQGCALASDGPCTIGGAGTPMSSNWPCESIQPFDEHARFLSAFGGHP